MTPSRVAITGLGIISPFGRGREAACDALRNARSGVRRIENIDTSELNCRIGGEVPAEAHRGSFKGFDRFSRFALIAAEEAAEQANVRGSVDPSRFGVIIGTGLGGCETLDAGFRRVYKDGQSRVPPTTIPWSMYNAAARRFSARSLASASRAMPAISPIPLLTAPLGRYAWRLATCAQPTLATSTRMARGRVRTTRRKQRQSNRFSRITRTECRSARQN